MKFRQIFAMGAILGAFSIVQAGPGGGTAESPDKTGMHAGVASGFTGFGGVASGAVIYTVPAGKRLVIESVTAMCGVPTTEKLYRAYVGFTNGGATLSHHLIPVDQGLDANPNFRVSLVNWSGRLYAEAGVVQVGAFKTGTLSGSYTCHYSLSGYLITVP